MVNILLFVLILLLIKTLWNHSMNKWLQDNIFKILPIAVACGGALATISILATSQGETRQAIVALTDTMDEVNKTLVANQKDRERAREDINENKMLSIHNRDVNQQQDKDIMELQIKTGIKP